MIFYLNTQVICLVLNKFYSFFYLPCWIIYIFCNFSVSIYFCLTHLLSAYWIRRSLWSWRFCGFDCNSISSITVTSIGFQAKLHFIATRSLVNVLKNFMTFFSAHIISFWNRKYFYFKLFMGKNSTTFKKNGMI